MWLLPRAESARGTLCEHNVNDTLRARLFVYARKTSSFCTLQGAENLPKDEFHHDGKSHHLVPGGDFPPSVRGFRTCAVYCKTLP